MKNVTYIFGGKYPYLMWLEDAEKGIYRWIKPSCVTYGDGDKDHSGIRYLSGRAKIVEGVLILKNEKDLDSKKVIIGKINLWEETEYFVKQASSRYDEFNLHSDEFELRYCETGEMVMNHLAQGIMPVMGFERFTYLVGDEVITYWGRKGNMPKEDITIQDLNLQEV